MTKAWQNKRLAIGILFILVLTSLLIIGLDRGSISDQQKRPSSYYTDATGSKGILMVLRRFLPDVRQLRSTIANDSFWQESDHNLRATLLVMGPTVALGANEAKNMEAWLRDGGQLVLALSHDWVDQATDSQAESEQTESEQTEPEQTEPEDKARQTQKKEHFIQQLGFVIAENETGANQDQPGQQGEILKLAGHFKEMGQLEVYLQENGQVQVGQVVLDKGRILVVPDAYSFSNERLSSSQNAVWLVQESLKWGNGRLLLDEYHHGFVARRSLPSLLISYLFSPWGAAFLHLLIAAIFMIFGPMRRFGSIREPHPEKRRDPMELITSRAFFFRSAKAYGLAMQTIHRHLHNTLVHSGIPDRKVNDMIEITEQSREHEGAPPARETKEKTHRAGSQPTPSTSQAYAAHYKEHGQESKPTWQAVRRASQLAGEILKEYQTRAHPQGSD